MYKRKVIITINEKRKSLKKMKMRELKICRVFSCVSLNISLVNILSWLNFGSLNSCECYMRKSPQMIGDGYFFFYNIKYFTHIVTRGKIKFFFIISFILINSNIVITCVLGSKYIFIVMRGGKIYKKNY